MITRLLEWILRAYIIFAPNSMTGKIFDFHFLENEHTVYSSNDFAPSSTFTILFSYFIARGNFTFSIASLF